MVRPHNRGSEPSPSPRRPSPRLRLHLLDEFHLTQDGTVVTLPASVQRVMAFVTLHDRPVSRGHVAGTLWFDRPEGRALGNLRSVLWRGRLLGPPLLHSRGGHLSLPPEIAVDVRELAARAHRLIRGYPGALRVTRDRIDLAGELLPGWSEDWVLIERERIRQLRLHALETLCNLLTDAGRFGEAVDAGLAAVAADPYRESAHCVLIKAHLAEGNRREALRQFQTYRRLIRDELDVEPSRDMVGLVSSGRAW